MHNDVTSLLLEAATLLLVGMSVVFVFLSTLIGAVTGIAWLCAKYPANEAAASAALAMSNRPSPAPQSPQHIPLPVIAAITAAIAQYRRPR